MLGPSSGRSAAPFDMRPSARPLSGMTILVTGASSGIGRAVSASVAAAGGDLVLVARSEAQLLELKREVETEYGTTADTSVVDITDVNELSRRLAAVPSLHGLVNCAGCNIPQAIESVTEDSFDQIFSLNVRAAFFAVQGCLDKFKAAGGGAVVNVSSQMGHVGAARRTVYCASKHAVEGMTKAMAVELAPHGIRVNSVCPTFVSTPMTESMFKDPQFLREVTSKIPLGRIGTAAEVAAAVVFLLSPAASLITGASLLLDGGWTAQ